MELIICEIKGILTSRHASPSSVKWLLNSEDIFQLCSLFFLGMINVCKRNLEWHNRKWG